MNSKTLNGYMIATASEENPAISDMRFVFTDFSPNANKVGVPPEEADNIIKSGRYMPVKAGFNGTSFGDHSVSVPIGTLYNLELGSHKGKAALLGHAKVWRTENPPLITHLEAKSSEEDAVQFSWELFYADSDVDDNGVEWLRGVKTRAATIVDDPAYAGRTPLLSFAERDILKELVEKVASLERLIMAENEENRQTEEAAVVEHTSTQLSDEVMRELEELRVFRRQVEEDRRRSEVANKRSAAIGERAAHLSSFISPEFVMSLSDDQFGLFVEMLSQIPEAKTVEATQEEDKSEEASRRELIPDPQYTSGEKRVDIKDLAQALKNAR